MKLFIFEPYEWDYCGGAIGVISDTFENAVKCILLEDQKQAREQSKEGLYNMSSYTNYKKKHFAKTSEGFIKDHWDQWLLTNTFDLPEETEERVVFDNWNYA